MRSGGTVLTAEQIAYMNHVVGKLYSLTQTNFDKIELINLNSPAVAQYASSADISDKAVINNIPMYMINGLGKLKETKQTSVFMGATIPLITDGKPHTVFFNAPPGFTGNQAYVHTKVNEFVKIFGEDDIPGIITLDNALSAISGMVSKGVITLSAVKTETGVSIISKCSKDFCLMDDYLDQTENDRFVNIECMAYVTFFKEGVE